VNLPILRSRSELSIWRDQQKGLINFVPTMGGLHKGHAKLIQSAKEYMGKEPSIVLVSIFVNPLQFGANEDFKNYPRELSKDCKIAFDSGANAVWAPSYKDVFPAKDISRLKIKIPDSLQKHLCGMNRKGHFDGVAKAVIYLLEEVKPDLMFLGEKDWQQLVILRHVIKELKIPLQIKGLGTIRDEDGLAYSSRNTYLTRQERAQSLALPKALQQASKDFKQNKEINLKKIEAFLEKNGLKVEYLETVDIKKLTPIQPDKKLCLLAGAVHCGKTRLIDHTFLMKRLPIVAIDGPAGAGKSTVTKAFAKKLGLIYLDTGAMYRAVTWLIQQKNIDHKNNALIVNTLKDLQLDIKTSTSGDQKVFINENDVTEAIRSPEITSKVSAIAANPLIREKLTFQQKNFGKKGGLVAEGRDIGTEVFPNAEVKVFLTASTNERAKRRALDMKKRGFDVPALIDLENQIIERDKLDSTREIAPLLKAKDAKELFTDGMNIEEVINSLVIIFRDVIPEEVWPSPTM